MSLFNKGATSFTCKEYIMRFRLRFRKNRISYWGERYSYSNDSHVRAIGRIARKQGYLTDWPPLNWTKKGL